MKNVANQSPVRVPFKLVLLSIIVLWAVYYVLASIRWEILGFGLSTEMMALRAIVVIGGVLVTLALWFVLRFFDAKSLRTKAIAALVFSMPAALMLAQINNTVFSEMNSKMEEMIVDVIGGDSEEDEEQARLRAEAEANLLEERDAYLERQQASLGMFAFLGPLSDIAFSRYFMMLAWCSLYLALLTGEKARVAERRASEFREAAKASELRSLRYQVNPHFLFNTLNSLSSLVMTGKAQAAEQMIQTMSRFYRHSLADDPTGDVALDDEFDLQQLYLEIEAVRFPERLKSVFDLPPELADARVPGMILQPLIENSVKYAVSPVNRPVTIIVEAREEFDRLVLTVRDDGPGVPENGRQGFGIGLANVRDRLEARFGADIILESGPVPGGYRTEIRIPLTRNGRN
ncbi:histidine kinase [Altererythrobacter ishigakiensis]|uniref:histidine kinase n=1 Tax=Altererythrobacter ishigakiensis TaxID=476157 RepID=A0A562USY5_9SPHN|nr:histidine kinase [Altererythrobacter ishigakiensis]TWJ08707.1 histidine kinase/DNA gyrase B/HSP90-like ATPase [Altererythrobacter ishigakiensis]